MYNTMEERVAHTLWWLDKLVRANLSPMHQPRTRTVPNTLLPFRDAIYAERKTGRNFLPATAPSVHSYCVIATGKLSDMHVGGRGEGKKKKKVCCVWNDHTCLTYKAEAVSRVLTGPPPLINSLARANDILRTSLSHKTVYFGWWDLLISYSGSPLRQSHCRYSTTIATFAVKQQEKKQKNMQLCIHIYLYVCMYV